MITYNQNKVALMDFGTGEHNILPANACQLIDYGLTQKLEEMERESPSLSRRRKMDYFGITFEKVGVDFQSNEPKYQAGKLASLDLYGVYAREDFVISAPPYAIAAA